MIHCGRYGGRKGGRGSISPNGVAFTVQLTVEQQPAPSERAPERVCRHLADLINTRVRSRGRTLDARCLRLRFAPNPTRMFSAGCLICRGAE
jgi:hypothetical protein